MTEKLISNRIPSLDGLRAVSIIFVVLGHAFGGFFKIVDIANLGVRTFFIISSYLIVGILYRNVINNTFSLKVFYFKRILRTFPAFYTYIILVGLLLLCLNFFDISQFWRAPIFLENYHPRSLWKSQQWFVGHSWSLAVEEQFYIGIALLFYLFNARKISKSQLIHVFFVILILAPGFRCTYMLFQEIPIVLRGSIHRSFETVMDALAAGALLAIIPIEKLKTNKILAYLSNKNWLLFLMILCFQSLNSSIIRELFGLKIRFIYNAVGVTLINLFLVFIIYNSINNYRNNTIFFKILNSRLFIKIGVLSYSIYLWQQVWLFKWDFLLIYRFMGLILCSLISYYLIEQKFLNSRNRMLIKYKIK